MMAKQADTTLRRLPERGSRDFDLACEILDAAKICHVGFTLDEQPYVVPMACARKGSKLLLHGSVASRLMTNLADGLLCCVTVTHLDGIVLARSAFHSSMNYRSVMVFGKARLVQDKALKLRTSPDRRSQNRARSDSSTTISIDTPRSRMHPASTAG